MHIRGKGLVWLDSSLWNCELLMDSGGGAGIVFSAVFTRLLCSCKTMDTWVAVVGHKTKQKHMRMEKCLCASVSVCMYGMCVNLCV